VTGKILATLLTVVVGIGAIALLYYVLNKIAELLPAKWENRVKPYFYVLPAVAVVTLYLVYPTLQTILYSFANADSTAYVGFQNYKNLLTNYDFIHDTLFNTLIWMIVAPTASVIIGLLVATLADRLRPRGEKVSKTLIFMPMAIGAVGAATIWRFVYATVTAGENQIGIQNAVWTKLGGNPVNWLGTTTFRFNTFELIVMFLWGQIGFSMVLMSAAIKSVPVDTLEAARIDGASERQIFFRVVVPQIRVTTITVFITVLIGVMKIFDVVYVMTDGQYNTNVIGVEFYNQLFTDQNNGAGAAIVVMLLVAVSPIIYYQVRQFRAQEAIR
jgi:alpha-glucoside transport system permease protein